MISHLVISSRTINGYNEHALKEMLHDDRAS
jgi:hypothetical protein